MRCFTDNAIQGSSVVDLFMGKSEGHDLISIAAPLIYYNIFKVSDKNMEFCPVIGDLVWAKWEADQVPNSNQVKLWAGWRHRCPLITRLLAFFRENNVAALKMIKDDEEDNSLEAVLDVVVKRI